jgi:hypothetical protein
MSSLLIALLGPGAVILISRLVQKKPVIPEKINTLKFWLIYLGFSALFYIILSLS